MTTNNLKIYSLLLEIRDSTFLSVQMAPSMEEAFAQAKLEFQMIHPSFGINESMSGIKIGLFLFKTEKELIEEHEDFIQKRKEFDKMQKEEWGEILFGEHRKAPAKKHKPVMSLDKEVKVKIPDTEETLKKQKNLLMKEIIENKDFQLFEMNKKVLSNSEIKYIEARILEDKK